METLITVVHILVALVLIGLVLIQDSKGGALGMGGSSGSNSVLGAGGAQTLAAKATRWVAVIFALTSIGLSVLTAHKTRSVVDSAAGALSIPAGTATPAETPAATAVPALPSEEAGKTGTTGQAVQEKTNGATTAPTAKASETKTDKPQDTQKK